MIYRGYTVDIEKTGDEIEELYQVYAPDHEHLATVYTEEEALDFIDKHKRSKK